MKQHLTTVRCNLCAVGSLALAAVALAGCADLYWAATGQPTVFTGYRVKQEKEPIRPRPTTFSGFYFSPTDGKVGYHMVSKNAFAQSPCDPGDVDKIEVDFPGFTVHGVIPPGLTAPGQSSDGGNGTAYFQGTPRQAGDWDVQATAYGVHCLFASAPHVNLTTTVHFHISP